jgi:hypothetical protein
VTTPTLTCSANTLRFADLPTRVSAVATAGFTGIGLRVAERRPLHDLAAVHDDAAAGRLAGKTVLSPA